MRCFVSILITVLILSTLLTSASGQQDVPAEAGTPVATQPSTAPTAPTTQRSREQIAREYIAHERNLARLFHDKEYEKAIAECRAQIELAPHQSDPHYNIACALAHLSKPDEAFAELSHAIEKGYNDLDHLKTDPDLESLHADARWNELDKQVRANELKGPFEKGDEIAGVQTIEHFPDGGFRYRLRMDPSATAERPNRLIIWLHPSGGSGNRAIEPLAPLFIKHGYALLVLTQKQFLAWEGDEFDKLMGPTLADVATLKGIDVRRPILLGYSAGGQMALEEWALNPGRFGGLILDAAYPLDEGKYALGQIVAMDLPKDPKIKSVPIFALVGGADGGSKLWEKVLPDWQKAEIPLTLTTVSGRKHEWLFDKDRLKLLEDWLSDVSAGKFPADRAPTTDESEDRKIY